MTGKGKNFDAKESKFKLIIWLNSGQSKVFYSFLRVEKKKGLVAAITQLEKLIAGTYRNQYNTAIIYENTPENNGREIIKYVGGEKIHDQSNLYA